MSFFFFPRPPRKVYVDREQAYETSVKLYQDASPGDVGVPSKLFPQEPGALQGSYPYESAVLELKLLTTDSCPQRKLECIGESRQPEFLSLNFEIHRRVDFYLLNRLKRLLSLLFYLLLSLFLFFLFIVPGLSSMLSSDAM